MEFTDLLGFIPGPEVGDAAPGEKNDESFTQTEKPGAVSAGTKLSLGPTPFRTRVRRPAKADGWGKEKHKEGLLGCAGLN
jgi:hypothetical protein